MGMPIMPVQQLVVVDLNMMASCFQSCWICSGLCAFRDGNGDAVVASGKDGHDKGEGSGEVFPFVHNQRFFHVCEKSVVAKKLLPNRSLTKKPMMGL